MAMLPFSVLFVLTLSTILRLAVIDIYLGCKQGLRLSLIFFILYHFVPESRKVERVRF